MVHLKLVVINYFLRTDTYKRKLQYIYFVWHLVRPVVTVWILIQYVLVTRQLQRNHIHIHTSHGLQPSCLHTSDNDRLYTHAWHVISGTRTEIPLAYMRPSSNTAISCIHIIPMATRQIPPTLWRHNTC